MAEQSTALRLADWLEDQYDPTHNQEDAAAELRRLHAEVNELKRTLALQQQSYEREIQIEVEAEREACAKVCENDKRQAMDWMGASRPGGSFADTIRARGKA